MLIKCPECGHDVSDTAVNCPNCGYGVQENIEEIQANIKEQEEKVAAEKAEKEQREAENRRKFSKWIKRGILVAIAVFVIVLIGEGIYVQKYNDYTASMMFIKAFDESNHEYDQTIGLLIYDTIEIPDLDEIDNEIIHINYDTESTIKEDNYHPVDYYYISKGSDVYLYHFYYSSKSFNLDFLGTAEHENIGALDNYYITAKKAYQEYISEDETDDFNYSEIIKADDYNLLLTKLDLLANNSKQMK